MFVWMLQTMLGLFFLNRIIQSKLFFVVADESKLKSATMQWSFIYLLCVWFLKNYNLIHLIVNISLPFFVYLLRSIFLMQAKNFFRENIVNIMDQIIMCMRSGRSIKEALVLVSVDCDEFEKFQLKEILNFLNFPNESLKSSNLLTLELQKELHFIQNSPAKSVDQLKSLRQKFKIEKNFRRKSRQASLQSHIQSLIMGFLYVSLFLYLFFQGNLLNNFKYILFSFVLYIFGATMSFFIGRKLKWKV